MVLRLKWKIFSMLPEEIVEEYQSTKAEAESVNPGTPEDKREEFRDRFCSEADRIGFLVGFIDGQVAGGCRLLIRQLETKPLGVKTTYKLGGLGGVFVRQSWQHQGIATAMIQKAINHLRTKDCDVAYLCTNIDQLAGLYGRVGFVHLKKGHTYLGKSGKRYTEFDGMLAPVKSQEIFVWLIRRLEPLDIGVGNW